MQFWFSHANGVSIREQLVTQIILGILSDDLAAGQRLPSTRELARRFHLHANTISAGYRQLEHDRWVEFRHGSGVYVRETKPEATLSPSLALDHLIADLLRSARELGVPLSAVRSRMRQWLGVQPPDHFLLVEPDEELRPILAAEMQAAVTFPVQSSGLRASDLAEVTENAIVIALRNKAKLVREALPAGTEICTLAFRSVPDSLVGWLPAPSGTLVGIASRWPEFLKLAKTILTAAAFDPDSLVFRDARKADWQRGLKQTAAVICDSLTATDLPKGCLPIVFSLLSDAAVAELRRHQDFITASL
jgi:DNA-binding transcriptional regulator YhcF (GntR family)